MATFPILIQQADQIVDKFGHVRDTASPELNQIRRELARVEGSVSRTLHAILRSAQSEGLVDKDVAPSLRDGRLVIPIAPGVKRKISGIVHDESASGRTLYIEPTDNPPKPQDAPEDMREAVMLGYNITVHPLRSSTSS